MRHSLRKKSASFNPPSKPLCRNLAITELSVAAIVQPLCVVNWISVLNKTWNTCISTPLRPFPSQPVYWLQCHYFIMRSTGAQIQRICNSKEIINNRSPIWVLSFISLISHVFLLIMACLCLVTLSFSYTQKFSSHCLTTKFNFQARFLKYRAKQFRWTELDTERALALGQAQQWGKRQRQCGAWYRDKRASTVHWGCK